MSAAVLADRFRVGLTPMIDALSPPVALADDAETPRASSRLKLLTTDELAAIRPPLPLVDGVLFQRGFSAIVAPYSAYKTFVALDLDLCIAAGLDWHGLTVTPGLVIYQAGEGGSGLHKRVEAWSTLNQVPSTAANIRWLPQALKLNDPRDLAEILSILRNLPDAPAKITFDTFARSFRGNENSVEDTSAYVEAVDAIREVTNAHVQFVHHAGWEGTRSRGSSNIPSSLDTEITLTRDDGRVTLDVTKQKDAEERKPLLTLERVPIGASLAFQTVAPTSPKLSPAERKTLLVVQRLGCTKATKWQKELEAETVSRRSFYNAKERLLTLSYVRDSHEGFEITEAGRQAL